MKTLFVFLVIGFLAPLRAESQTVLISGASGGIGQATSLAFAEMGWSVWAGYRHQIPDALKNHPNVHPVCLDVTNPDSIKAAISQIEREEGHLDALINNAGYGLIGAEECVSLEEAQKLFDVNFFGVLRLTQAALPLMRVQNSGHIINISSTSGVRAVPGLGLYAASKFALEGLSESLAVTLSPWNISVSLVEPGTVKNDWTEHCLTARSDEPLYEHLHAALRAKLISLARNGQECDQIAALIVAIAQEKNPHLRYQTSPQVEGTLAKKLVDLTGDEMRQIQQIFFNTLFAQ